MEWNPEETGEDTEEARARLAVNGWASSVVWVIPCCLHLANLNSKAALDNKLDTVIPPAGLALLPIGGGDQASLGLSTVSAGECIKLIANQRSSEECATRKAGCGRVQTVSKLEY